jgi:hypothetical protein
LLQLEVAHEAKLDWKDGLLQMQDRSLAPQPVDAAADETHGL